jgi:AcrR family transcriptional regulator
VDGFERRKEQSKEDIRRAAEELFSRFGTEKISVNDIARRAGVSQATIYNNFGSKENLVHDYRRSLVSAIASRFRDILVLKKSFFEKAEGLLQSWIDVADRYKIEMETPSSRDTVPGEIEKSFRAFIKEGKKQGNIGRDLSDDALLAYIRFFQQGIAGSPELLDNLKRDDKLSRDLFHLFIYGLEGKN